MNKYLNDAYNASHYSIMPREYEGTGNIAGTMSSYKILPEKEKAKFTITLSTGGTIEGTCKRKKDACSFGGLYKPVQILFEKYLFFNLR